MARKRRGSVRTSGKKVAQRIHDNATYLRDHPEHAAPDCQGSCPLFCTFKRARKRIQKVHKHREDGDKLKKLGKRFHELGRAYAAVLRVALEGTGKLEYLQNVNTPRGKVPIAPWTKAPAPCHVGLQHRHDKALRLMAALPFVDEDDVVYATEDGLVCAHDKVPPEHSLQAALDAMELTRQGQVASCPHADGPADQRAVVHVDWLPAELELRYCARCGPSNHLVALQSQMIAKDPLSMLSIEVDLPPLEDPEGEGIPRVATTLPDPVLRRYVRGELDDQGLLQEAEQARAARLEAVGEPMIIVGRRVHRPPFQALLDELDPSFPVDAMLERVLEDLERPIVLEKPTPVGLLHRLWAKHGEAALTAVLGEEGHEHFDPGANPSDLERLMRRVGKEASRQQVARELPAYSSLPTPVDLADKVARALIFGGKQEAQQHLTSPPARSRQAMAMALVRALELPNPSWTIDPREKDMADHLVPYVEEVVQARGEDYHQALQTLLKATGSTEDLEREDG